MTEPDVIQQARKALADMIPRLRRFGFALTGSRDEADDLVQIALERALLKLHLWEPGTRLDFWVFRIAHNAWIDEVRARRRRGTPVALDEGPDLIGDDGRRASEQRLQLAQVRSLVAQLPEEQRAVLSLVAVEGFSYQEASDLLGVPIGTVMSRLARARKAIAAKAGGLEES